MDLMSVAQLLGNFGEFFGAIAVLLTLIYLTAQIRQSRRLIETQVNQSSYDQWAAALQVVGGSPQVAELCTRGFRSLDELGESEYFQFQAVVTLGLNALEHRLKQSDNPAQDPDIPMLWEIAKYWLDHPGGRQYWDKNSQGFAPDFTSWIDRHLEDLDSQRT